jgi:quinol monooxygenase YgiN
MAVISVVATFNPKENQENEVEQILRGMVGPTRKEPGCLRYELYGAAGTEQQFVLIEAYADQAALESHRATEHYKKYRSSITDALKEPIKVAVLSTIDSGR